MTQTLATATRVWWQHPDRQQLLAAESEHINDVLAGIFGYHGLWLAPGAPVAAPSLGPYHWVCQSHHAEVCDGAIRTEVDAWPWQSGAFAVVVLQHVIDGNEHAEAILDQVERVLAADGVLLLTCFNPASLLGLQVRWAARGERLAIGAMPRRAIQQAMGLRSLQCMLWRACHFGPFARHWTVPWLGKKMLGGSYLAVVRKRRGASIRRLRPRSVVTGAAPSGVSAKVSCRTRHAALVLGDFENL